MSNNYFDSYLKILQHELVPALGCTEPGAVAYCTAKAAELLKKEPEHIDITCSGNIVKNVKGVVVPNSEGMVGIEAAAILGAIIKGDSWELEVLNNTTHEDIVRANELLKTDYCKAFLEEGEDNLYIRTVATAGNDEAEVIIKQHHTNIIYLRLNDDVMLDVDVEKEKNEIDELKKLLNVKDIITFIRKADYAPICDILDLQLRSNAAIAQEGLTNEYGAAVGKTIRECDGDNIKSILKAAPAAGSDARMGGCSFPVVVVCGSGNQGITVTAPLVEYARYKNSSDDKLHRALMLSNLIAIHIKRHIGPLSAFCGAVSAGAGVGAALAYLDGYDDEVIANTVINELADVAGIVCDGAKASCAAKIASSVDCAITAKEMAAKGRVYRFGEGLVIDDVDQTIRSFGHMGKVGMAQTDIEILHLMLGDIRPCC